MARLPTPGGDSQKWGEILNDFLMVAHKPDGSLKIADIVAQKYIKPATGIPKSDLDPTVQSALDSAISGLAPDATGTTKGIIRLSGDLTGDALSPLIAPNKILGASAGAAGHIQAGTITNANIHNAAAIAKSKLAPLAISNDDVAVGAAIVQSKIQGLEADLASKASTNHTHAASDITSGIFALARIPTGTTATTVALGNHTHGISDITGLQSSLDSKANGGHNHTAGDITDFAATTASIIGNNVQAGSNVTVDYNSSTGITTISSTGTIDPGTPSDTVLSVAGRTGVVVLGAGDITSGTFTTNRIPDLDAAKITSGILDANRIPSIPANKITGGTFDIARIPTGTTGATVALGDHKHVASDITGGTFDIARIPTGTTGATVSLGNHNHDGSYALVNHNHDDRYYTETEIDTSLSSKINVSEKGTANGLATLDASGKLPANQLPALAIKDTFTVASQAAMLGLSAQRGDMAIRTDIGKTYVLATDTPAVLGDWKEITSGATGVTAHGSLTGLGNDDHPQYLNDTRGDARYYTKAQIDTSLVIKQTIVRWTGTAWPARPTGAAFGVLFLSTNDKNAPAPNDVNLMSGDVWRRHPEAV